MSTDTQNSAPVSVEPVALPDAILLMAQRIAADDFEHCTSDPIFTVQKRRLITGLDLDYTEEVGWFCHDGGGLVDEEEAKSFEDEYQESGDMPYGYTRTGYIEEWEHFATYVTLEAAREFVSKKGDQYRVYVDSGCRNHEWKALRAFLLQIAANPVLAAPVAAPVSAEPTDDEIIDMAVEPLGIDCDRMPYGVIVFARTLLSRYSAAPVAAQAQSPSIDRQRLHNLVDVVWNEATESTAVPDKPWADRLIDRVFGNTQAQQPVSGADGLPTSPTQGMTLGQRIAHVGGRENAQGYVEFGSPMAVNALIQHVLRDFHRQGRVNLASAQKDADKVDAERYRAIKFGPTLFKRSYSGDGAYRAIEYLPLTGEQLDSFADAARKEPGQ